MNQPLYIQSAVAISPQHTFNRDEFLQPVAHSDNGKLFVIDTDYRPFISPVAIRRMSRLMKMAISAAMQSLKEAEVTTPDGIITGTGRGSMSDMEHFLNDMIRLEEGPMNPTSFIQSTYNSPNGWIAMQVKSTAYNQTYVHRGCSLELAMLDARLVLSDAGEEPANVLTGSYDEITDEYFIVKDKINYWKSPAPDSLKLLEQSDTPGTIGGEGCTFFIFSNKPGKAHAVIRDLAIIQEADGNNIAATVTAVLKDAGLEAKDVDLLLTGMNGDVTQQHYYHATLQLFDENVSVAGFKHLCGEYDTSTGFAIWLCDWMIGKKKIPELLYLKKGTVKEPRHILLINHYILGSASVVLVSAV